VCVCVFGMQLNKLKCTQLLYNVLSHSDLINRPSVCAHVLVCVLYMCVCVCFVHVCGCVCLGNPDELLTLKSYAKFCTRRV